MTTAYHQGAPAWLEFGDHTSLLTQLFVTAATLFTRIPVDPEESAGCDSGRVEQTSAPRDLKPLHRTADLLFLGRVCLASSPRDVRWVLELKAGKGEARGVLLQGANGELLSPLSGAARSGGDTASVACRMNPSTVRGHFRKSEFFFLRSLLECGTDNTVVVDGTVLRTKSRRGATWMAVLAGMLGQPLAEQQTEAVQLDPIAILRQSQCELEAWPRPTDRQLLCPLDGPVEPVVGEVISPKETWAHLHGRHYISLLCPRCLGSFGSTLAAMN